MVYLVREYQYYYYYIIIVLSRAAGLGGVKIFLCSKNYLSRCSYMSWCPKGGSNVKTGIRA